jgi:predicted RNA binding protein YcfA (HicA-like mRNA interferase family)
MPRAPRVTGSEIVRALRKAGFTQVRQTGSHIRLERQILDEQGNIVETLNVTVPVHAGETIGPNLLNKILRQARMTVTEFQSLL